MPEASDQGGIRRDAGAVVLKAVNPAWVRAEMMARARWVTSRMNADGVVEQYDVPLPRDVADAYGKRPKRVCVTQSWIATRNDVATCRSSAVCSRVRRLPLARGRSEKRSYSGNLRESDECGLSSF